jgi:hypothetical protein
MKTLGRSVILGVVSVALIGFAGCGADDGGSVAKDTPESEPTSEESSAPASSLPACDEIWRKGADLPAGYAGCADGTTEIPAEFVTCSSGQTVVTHDNQYWAVAGNIISQAKEGLDESPRYRQILISCTG